MDQAQWNESSINFIQSDDQTAFALDATNGIGDYIVQLPDGTYATASSDPRMVVGNDEDIPVLNSRFQVKPGPRQNQQGTRQNGATRLSSSSAAESTVVSLLTGQEYVQQAGAGRPGTAVSGAQRKSRNQIRQNQNRNSLSQFDWQQSSGDAGAFNQQQQQQAALQGEALQQALQQALMSEAMADVKPGEKMYVSIDGITYEIVADTGDQDSSGGQDAATELASTGIGLEELARISAEQETLKLVDYQSMGAANGGGVEVTAMSQNRYESGTDLLQVNDDGHQQYAEFVQQQRSQDGGSGGGVTAVDENGMQFVFMSPEGNDPGTMMMMQMDGEGVGGGGGGGTGEAKQDLVFPSEQQLQELVAKGFDLSNCQFVVQESDDPQQNGTIYVTTTSGQDATSRFQSQQLVSMTTNGGDVLTMLAEASTVVASQERRRVNGDDDVRRRLLSESALAPDDYDDGEYDSLKSSTVIAEDDFLASSSSSSKPLPGDHFLESFASFVNGTKPETLASVANSAITKKPQMPVYVPEFCRRSTTARGGHSSSNFARSGKVSDRPTNTASGGPTPAKRLRPENPDTAGGHGPSTFLGRPRTPFAHSMDKEGKRKDCDGEDVNSDPFWRSTMQGQHLDVDDIAAMRGRGRGRPRGSGKGGRLARNETRRSSVVMNAPIFVSIDLNEAHTYQKGDFVIERKDLYKHDGFPVWKIEAGRLLQKFDPVFNDTGVLHKSASIYSSWSGDIRTNFKAIGVEVITSTGRKYEIVQIVDKYLPKPPNESLENDCLMELFNVYIQSLFSQSITSSFFSTIEQSQEEYYLGPLHQIDSLLTEAEQAVLSLISFGETFKAVMDERPFYQMTEPNPDLQHLTTASCQATLDVTLPAVKTVKFFGPAYDRRTLQLTSDENKSQEFSVSQHAAEQLLTYHGLHHYKFQLFKKCQEEAHFIKRSNRDYLEQTVLDECLKNRTLVQQGLRELKGLLENCSIVVSIVTKTEEDDLGQDDVGRDDIGQEDAGQNDVGQDDVGQNDIGQNDVGQNNIGQDDVGQKDVGQNDIGQDDVGQKDVGQNNIGQDDVGRDDIGQEDAGQNDVSQDDVGQNDIGQNDVGQNNIGQDDVGQKDVGQNDIGQDDVGQKDVGQNNIGQDDVGRDDVGQDDARPND